MSNVEVSQLYAATPEKVWSVVGAPAGIADWHPAIVRSPTDSDRRTLVLADGTTIDEQILGHSDGEMSYTYRIVQSQLPLRDYESTLSVDAEGDGARLTWAGSFEAEGAPAADVEALVRGLFEAGLQGVAEAVTA